MENSAIKIISGEIPVLFSAPHCKLHRRPKLSMAYKQSEPITDRIVKELCLRTNGFGIYLNRRIEYDPNYHKERRNEYKRKVREIIKENKIKCFVDVHGILDNYGYDLAIYYPSRYSNSMDIAKAVSEEIGKKALRGINAQILKFPYDNGEPLSEFVASELRVPAIQIEIAKYIRHDDRLLTSFIENLTDVITKRFV